MGNTILVDLGLVDKEHRLPVRQELFNVFLVHCMQVLVVFFGITGYSVYFLNATQASCPPKPRESEIPMVRSAFTALLGV